MRTLPLLFLLLPLLLSDCTSSPKTSPQKASPLHKQQISFQKILDSHEVKGCILIYDLNEQTYHSNDFDWAKSGQLPASTYKIPNSIIALETGIVENDSSLVEWDGQTRWNDNWNQDLTFRRAFQYSCVPCYQGFARQVGVTRMQQYIDKFQYGSIQVDSSNLDIFWLRGNARITPFEQIDFLLRYDNAELPIAKRTYDVMRRIMLVEETATYTLYAKTGRSIQEDKQNAWYVGIVEKPQNTYFFAVNIEPTPDLDLAVFANLNRTVSRAALAVMNIL